MPRVGQAYYLTGANAHTQLNSGGTNTVQTLTFENGCSAIMVSAKTANAFVTFDQSVPAATNGLEIVAGGQPVLIPLGFNAHNGHQLKMIGAAINAVLNVLQLN